MLREPKLAVFYSPPKHDLRLKTEEEQRRTELEEEPPPAWPDTGQPIAAQLAGLIIQFLSNRTTFVFVQN